MQLISTFTHTFRAVSDSLEAIPEEEENESESPDEAMDQPKSGEETQGTSQSQPAEQAATQCAEASQSEPSITNNVPQEEPQKDEPAERTNDNDGLIFRFDPSITRRYQENTTLFEELSHQDINDMYCVLPYSPQSGRTKSRGCARSHCASQVTNHVTKTRGSHLKYCPEKCRHPLGSPIPSGKNVNFLKKKCNEKLL